LLSICVFAFWRQSSENKKWWRSATITISILNRRLVSFEVFLIFLFSKITENSLELQGRLFQSCQLWGMFANWWPGHLRFRLYIFVWHFLSSCF
jgi:hypothetical protein